MAFALLALVPSLPQVFNVASKCKQGFDLAKKVSNVPDEALILWHEVDVLEQQLRVAMRLLNRETTLTLVTQAVMCTLHTLDAVERLLLRATTEDSRPYDEKSWTEWWSSVPAKATENVSRMGKIPKLLERVQRSATLLNLALTSVNSLAMSCPLVQITTGRQSMKSNDLELHKRSYNTAERIFMLFDKGEVKVYQLGLATEVRNSKGIVETYTGGIVLHRDPTEETYSILLLDCDDADEGEEQDASEAAESRVVREVKLGAGRGAITCTVKPEDYYVGVGGNGQSMCRVGFGGAEGSVDFQSCVMPGQLCDFPKELENFYACTIESFMMVVALVEGVNKLAKGKRQIGNLFQAKDDPPTVVSQWVTPMWK